MSEPNLVTTCNFNNRDYFLKMHVTNNNLEIVITDKLTGEDWQCSYDASYIENITQKTGNFKQFNVFIAMLKSGLLKTSNSVYLDLMTFDDLDALRNHRIRAPYSMYHASTSNNNRKYLILTYTVEFDRIHYPLPLEYCGPPDPKILQQNIVKLEAEITNLKQQINGGNNHKQDSKMIISLEKKIDDLSNENIELRNEISKLTRILERKSNYQNYMVMLQNAIKNLEKSVLSERKSHHKLVEKLRRDKIFLTQQLDRVKNSEKDLFNKQSTRTYRNKKLVGHLNGGAGDRSRSPSPNLIRNDSCHTNMSRMNKRRPRSASRSESDKKATSRNISSSSRSSNSTNEIITPRSNLESRKPSTPRRTTSKNSELDFSNLEKRILALQKMLEKGLHIT